MEKEAKKVLILLPALTAGGTERTAAVLANYLVKEGLKVTVLVMFKRDKFYELHKDVKLIEPGYFNEKAGKIFHLPLLLLYLRRNIILEKPDTVFSLGYILYSLISSFGLKTRVVISARSSPVRTRFPKNTILNKLYELLHYLFRPRVDMIIAQTNHAKIVYESKYRCPVIVIPNFLREIHDHHTERLNHIITLGRCVFEKGQKYLIDAFARIKAPHWKLIIVGDGPLINSLKDQVQKLNLDERVIFLGFQKDVDKYLAASKIFAFTSVIEGYPNALIEAMANGLAPVSFNCVAGPSEIIKDGENGYLVEVGDVEDFANKLQLLIDNPVLLSKIADNAKRIRQTNNLGAIAGKFKEVLICDSI